MDSRRQQLMLAFVAYMNLRQIEDKELRRKLIADMPSKVYELVDPVKPIPEITPERSAALELERQGIEERAPASQQASRKCRVATRHSDVVG